VSAEPPQRKDGLEAFGLAETLRLVGDTAALRSILKTLHKIFQRAQAGCELLPPM